MADLPLVDDKVPTPAPDEDVGFINDSGNEDPGSIEKDALVPLIEGDKKPS